MDKTKKRDWKKVIKSAFGKIKNVGGWIGRKLWGARQYIVAIFIGMFALFAKGWGSGYAARRDEEEEKLDERMKLLDKLAGADTEEADEIAEAVDLIDEYGLDELRKAAAALEDGTFDDEI